MPAAPEIRAGHFYHVYNRGVNRQAIFFSARNYRFFIERLRHYFQPNLVNIVAYCLMPTHFHLLIQSHIDDFGMEVMQPFVTSYTKAINREQGRVGSLFQGKYKADLVSTDAHIRNATLYIHRNPIEAGYVERLTEWPYSSYPDYIGLRDGTLPSSHLILRSYESQAAYRESVESSNYEPDENFRQWLLHQEP
jgi:putative transposase